MRVDGNGVLDTGTKVMFLQDKGEVDLNIGSAEAMTETVQSQGPHSLVQ